MTRLLLAIPFVLAACHASSSGGGAPTDVGGGRGPEITADPDLGPPPSTTLPPCVGQMNEVPEGPQAFFSMWGDSEGDLFVSSNLDVVTFRGLRTWGEGFDQYSVSALAGSDSLLVALGRDAHEPLDYQLFASTDLGVTWKPTLQDEATLPSTFAVGGQTIFGIDHTASFVSTDTGKTWVESTRGELAPSAIAAVDDHTVFIAGDQKGVATILRSMDGGATFASWTDPACSGCRLTAIWAADAQNVYAAGTLNGAGVVYRSIDGGATFVVTAIPSGTLPLLALRGNSKGDLVAGGKSGTTIYSGDHGATWAALSVGSPQLTEDVGSVWVDEDRVLSVLEIQTTGHAIIWSYTGVGTTCD